MKKELRMKQMGRRAQYLLARNGT
ncbi:MAG: hypothetical protein QOC64_285, partial [Solirubrobacteraceae bacterium]|nr:hypothetical protein [Solirubrobacteraceae bacterium]